MRLIELAKILKVFGFVIKENSNLLLHAYSLKPVKDLTLKTDVMVYMCDINGGDDIGVFMSLTNGGAMYVPLVNEGFTGQKKVEQIEDILRECRKTAANRIEEILVELNREAMVGI